MSNKPERLNPYSRLLNEIKEFCSDMKYAHTVAMFRYPVNNIKTASWNINDLYERVMAAGQLGYEVKLFADNDGLTVKYVKKIKIPFKWM